MSEFDQIQTVIHISKWETFESMHMYISSTYAHDICLFFSTHVDVRKIKILDMYFNIRNNAHIRIKKCETMHLHILTSFAHIRIEKEWHLHIEKIILNIEFEISKINTITI